MNKFLVNALITFNDDGTTDEVACEAKDIDEVLKRVKEVIKRLPAFRAITIVHIEDASSLMQGVAKHD